MRLVIDTNVFVSALFFGGIPAEVFKLIDAGKIKPCFTPATFGELKRVLYLQRFYRMREHLEFSLGEILQKLESVGLFFIQAIPAPNIIEKDPSDNQFLLCALLARADFIISGDKHLLNLKEFRDIPILKPQEFIGYFKKQKRK